jgi:uncharacterized YigZ family protein
MEPDNFLTIESPSEGCFKEKGSRFLSFAFPVEDESQIQKILDQTRKQFHDARHHCYAWRLGSGQNHFRSNDDGEPVNSAGKPILGQIQSFQLTNILVVVVRYFGGTLLGVGGLMHAYKTAAMEALNNSRIIRQYVFVKYKLYFPYENMNLVMRILKDMEIEQWDQKFELNCELKLKVRKSEEEKLLSAFRPDSSVRIHVLNDA